MKSGKLLNTEFGWDMNDLSLADTVSGVPLMIDIDIDTSLMVKKGKGNRRSSSWHDK